MKKLDSADPALSGAGGSGVSPVQIKRASPVKWWAIVGLLCVVMQAYVYVHWVSGPDFRHQNTGADPVPDAVKVWAWFVQIATLVLFVVSVTWVIRQVMRERRLTFDAMLMIAFASVIWQEPILNYIRPTFLYNSYLLNYGMWAESIPGWITPNGGNHPEPLLLAGLGFLTNVLYALAVCAAMRAAKRRFPKIGMPGLLLVALAAGVAQIMLFELFMVRTTLYAYPATIEWLSLWGGERYQYPLYEAFFWGAVWGGAGALRYFRDDKGRSVVERGADSINVSERGRTAIRTLAIVGFVNVLFMLYNIGMNFMGLHVDRTPNGYQTWLRNDICGAGTEYACPGPDVPIPIGGYTTQPDPATTG